MMILVMMMTMKMTMMPVMTTRGIMMEKIIYQ